MLQMRKLFGKPLFGFIFNVLTWYVLSNADSSSTNYLLPIFGNPIGCIGKDNRMGNDCNDLMQGILTYCGFETLRELVKTFDFYNNITYTCPTDTDVMICDADYSDKHKLNLNQTQYYGIKKQFEKAVNQDRGYTNTSLSIFFIGVSCLQMKNYPDLKELFLKGLEDLQKYLLDVNLHALVVLLHWNNSTKDLCPTAFTNQKFAKDNFIETRIINYNNLSDLYKQTGKLCGTPIPVYPEEQDHSSINSWKKAATISIICSVILGLIILFILFWANQIRRRWKESKIEAFADAHTKTARHIIFGKYKDEWEVTPKELKVDAGTVLGQGAFGIVYKGFLKKQRNKEKVEMDVAVKFTTDHSTESMRQDMIEEIGFMKALGSHENLLVMVGYVKSIDNPVICTVFCSNGDLIGVLKKHDLHYMTKEKCQNVEICLLLPDLLRIAIEVCDGLIYLASFNYVHRDIAARNVLLTENMTAKLGDFGLCKKLELHEICIIDREGKFPVRYLPFESLKFGEFSTKTDVWAFGVLLFEMFSGGELPFKEIDMSELTKHLENDGKPIIPETTPNPIIQLLNGKVFQKYPSRRLDFKDIKKELKSFYSIVSNVLLMERNSSKNGSFRSAKSFNNV